MKNCKAFCCEDFYRPKPKDTPEVNRLRNILSALINLHTQIGEPKNMHEMSWISRAEFWIKNYTEKIQRLRRKES